MKNWHPAEIPDDTLVYVCGFGETTAGELRGDVPKDEPTMLELSAQMWSDIINEDIRCRISGDVPRSCEQIQAESLESLPIPHWRDLPMSDIQWLSFFLLRLLHNEFGGSCSVNTLTISTGSFDR